MADSLFFFLGETGWNNHFNYHDHSRRKKRGHLAGKKEWLDELQPKVKQIKHQALCQLHICKQCISLVSSSRYLSLFLPFYDPSSPHADRDLSLHRANRPSQHDHVHPVRHIRPWGDLLSWLSTFLPEEEAAGDMLAWEQTVQLLAGG